MSSDSDHHRDMDGKQEKKEQGEIALPSNRPMEPTCFFKPMFGHIIIGYGAPSRNRTYISGSGNLRSIH